MKFDHINNITREERECYIDEFFGAMDLTKQQKDERKSAADSFADFVLFVFSFIVAYAQFGTLNYEAAKEQFATGYRERITPIVNLDSNLERYTNDFADDTMLTTQTHLAKELVGVIGIENTLSVMNNSYYLSEARAIEMGANMSLDVVNYKDFVTAIERGFKHKKWIAMRDNRVRKTHSEVDGAVIPIGEYFEVGDALLAFPHDTVTEHSTGMNHLEEITNCRCSFRYVK